MSINLSFAQFNEQLLLKLTLGQQFKQALTVPDLLANYHHHDLSTAKAILNLNQDWMLIQQAGYQAATILPRIAKQLEKKEESIVEQHINYPLIETLQWILQQENPSQYFEWIKSIFLLAEQQQQVIPRYLVVQLFKIAGRLIDPYLLAKVMPDFAFKGDILTQLRTAKHIRTYLLEQDETGLLTYLNAQKGSDWNYLIGQLIFKTPDFINKYIDQIWPKAIEQPQIRYALESIVSYHMPLPKFESVYHYFRTLTPQNFDMLQRNGGLLFYLYYQDNPLYVEAIAQVKQCVVYDAKAKKLNLKIDMDADAKLEAYGFFNGNADVSSSRKELKNALQSNLAQAYSSFVNGQHGKIYLKRILQCISLQDWKVIFGQWDDLLKLDTAKNKFVLEAFIDRCRIEDNQSLALWFYQHMADWLDQYVRTDIQYSEQESVQIFRLLQSTEAKQLLTERLNKHATAQDYSKFWFICQNYPKFDEQQALTILARQLLMQRHGQLKADDSKTIEQLKTHAEWLVLNAYPIDFSVFSVLFSRSEWMYLSNIICEKQQIILNP